MVTTFDFDIIAESYLSKLEARRDSFWAIGIKMRSRGRLLGPIWSRIVSCSFEKKGVTEKVVDQMVQTALRSSRAALSGPVGV
jgi:hypothetical protein